MTNRPVWTPLRRPAPRRRVTWPAVVVCSALLGAVSAVMPGLSTRLGAESLRRSARSALVQEKLGRDLAELVPEYLDYEAAHGGGGDGFEPSRRSLSAQSGWVVLEARASGAPSALARDLAALGMRNVRVTGNLVSGHLPIAALPAAAALPGLAFARNPGRPELHSRRPSVAPPAY